MAIPQDEVDALFAAHLPQLEAFVRVRADAIVVQRESIRDVVQSVCREAVQDLDDFEYRGDREFRSWLFLLATRKLVDRYRFHRQARRDVQRERHAVADLPSDGILAGLASGMTPSRLASAREQAAEIELALHRLPDNQQEAVAYSKILGLSYTDIAERMNVSESAVRNLVARGLARVASDLARER